MKKLFTSALLAIGAMTAANAQTQYDISTAITSPQSNQAFACDDIVQIIAEYTNNGPNDMDLTSDTTLRWGVFFSHDSTYTSGGQDLFRFSAFDSINIPSGQKMEVKSRELKARELFTVYDDGGQNPFVFRDNVAYGFYMIYADHSGVGRVDPQTNLFAEAANFEDTNDQNDRIGVVVELCTDLNSIRNINANTSNVVVFPNPTTNGSINFAYSFATNEEATVRVMDVTGRTVLTQQVKGNAGVQNITLDVANLQTGMYNLEIATANGRGVSKFSVAK